MDGYQIVSEFISRGKLAAIGGAAMGASIGAMKS